MRATISATVSLAGETASTSQTRTDDGIAGVTPGTVTALPHAHAGVLTTRNSASSGVITTTDTDLVTGNHAILTWIDPTDGVTLKHRYNVDCSVAAFVVTVSGGTGDDLPAALTVVNPVYQYTVALAFDFDYADTFVVTMNVRGVAVFLDANEVELCVVDMVAGGMAYWCKAGGFPEPITGDPVTHVIVGSGSTVAATNFLPKILCLYDSTEGSGQ